MKKLFDMVLLYVVLMGVFIYAILTPIDFEKQDNPIYYDPYDYE